jgi:hypothetical protein
MQKENCGQNIERIMKEVLDTEIVYLENLNYIYDNFYRPLTSGKFDPKSNCRINISDKDIIEVVPGNVNDILTYHRKFLILAENKISSTESPLLRFIKTFSVYIFEGKLSQHLLC